MGRSCCVAVVAVLVACGPEAPNTVSDTSTPLGFCQASFDATEARACACAHIEVTAETHAYGHSTWSCPDPKAIEAGHVAFDPSRAAACVQKLQSLDCGWYGGDFVMPPECRAVFTGSVAAGQACYTDDECVSGRCGGTTCPGTCRPQLGVGERCTSGTAVCGPSLSCDWAQTGQCVPLLPTGAEGEPCIPQYENDQARVCLAGLYCGRSTTTATGYECKRLRSSGPCESNGCTVDTTCSDDSGTCVPLLTFGQDCRAEPWSCVDGFCNESGKCANLPKLGQECVVGSESYRCAEGWCDKGRTGRCTAFSALGGTCAVSGSVELGRCGPSTECVDDVCVAKCAEP